MFSDIQHNGSRNTTSRRNEDRADVGTISQHRPVLLQETLELLSVQPSDVVLDATLGGGGHAHAIASKLSKKGHLIGIDADSQAVERSRARLEGSTALLTLVQENFRNLDTVLHETGGSKVDKVLLDLGWSSDQLAQSRRGFTFQKDEPLSMTLANNTTDSALTAYDIVNSWDEENIADILFHYGGERLSRRIAKAIVQSRKKAPIKTTFDLVKVIEGAVPTFYKKGRLNPATKTFQALRITVNDEIEALKEGLAKAYNALEDGGRIAVISFHSLEDKVVKETFREWSKDSKGVRLTKKPITATRAELLENPRARSAKLRGFEKHTHHGKK